MNCTIKKILITLTVPLLLSSCIIQDAQPEECETKEILVTEIKEGSSYDIVFKENNDDRYYINRGLEQGLTMADLEKKVLNKKVTLHLYKFWFGTSEHISQLTVDGNVLFTEFD
ncbi:hypothetical protein J1N09_01160 [Aureitalea sp. L0-47]|uniref:hypothetical protein n=1 Tax=Aureitalea sp. L0-47 TaxID=2816962 RepID=UPI0022375002|nr:hypothetical protein [Aureitalea sp. L0-47]MCW5518428.1 hypothetical protein [Aureitalea sp. L0-47]